MTPALQKPVPATPPGHGMFTPRRWAGIVRLLQLSPRELQVVQGLFDQHTERAMALRLGISVHTVHTHLERLYLKLGVSSRGGVLLRVFAASMDL